MEFVESRVQCRQKNSLQRQLKHKILTLEYFIVDIFYFSQYFDMSPLYFVLSSEAFTHRFSLASPGDLKPGEKVESIVTHRIFSASFWSLM